MSDHGIYIIEDTGGCVGDCQNATVNYLQSFINGIYYWPQGVHPKWWQCINRFPPQAKWSDRNIVGIAFYRWIVFIMCGNNPGDTPHLLDVSKIDDPKVTY